MTKKDDEDRKHDCVVIKGDFGKKSDGVLETKSDVVDEMDKIFLAIRRSPDPSEYKFFPKRNKDTGFIEIWIYKKLKLTYRIIVK